MSLYYQGWCYLKTGKKPNRPSGGEGGGGLFILSQHYTNNCKFIHESGQDNPQQALPVAFKKLRGHAISSRQFGGHGFNIMHTNLLWIVDVKTTAMQFLSSHDCFCGEVFRRIDRNGLHHFWKGHWSNSLFLQCSSWQELACRLGYINISNC